MIFFNDFNNEKGESMGGSTFDKNGMEIYAISEEINKKGGQIS